MNTINVTFKNNTITAIDLGIVAYFQAENGHWEKHIIYSNNKLLYCAFGCYYKHKHSASDKNIIEKTECVNLETIICIVIPELDKLLNN